jgi:hypothetical protein
MRDIFLRLTDADTALGNFILCGLAVAAFIVWFVL